MSKLADELEYQLQATQEVGHTRMGFTADFEHWRTIIAALRSEAQPVAWVSEQKCDKQFVDGRPCRIWWECTEGVGMSLYAHPQPVPEGMVLVPVEPTEEMLLAGYNLAVLKATNGNGPLLTMHTKPCSPQPRERRNDSQATYAEAVA